jgi:aminoglycoside/choline kinase family phosphotransferase
MVTEKNNPGVIDFQDAVYGPITYDASSLWRDAYISWPEERVIDWVIKFWEEGRQVGLPMPNDFGQFYRDFEWMGLQRHLKILGIFARWLSQRYSFGTRVCDCHCESLYRIKALGTHFRINACYSG